MGWMDFLCVFVSLLLVWFPLFRCDKTSCVRWLVGWSGNAFVRRSTRRTLLAYLALFDINAHWGLPISRSCGNGNGSLCHLPPTPPLFFISVFVKSKWISGSSRTTLTLWPTWPKWVYRLLIRLYTQHLFLSANSAPCIQFKCPHNCIRCMWIPKAFQK